jgi:hypothetical protein
MIKSMSSKRKIIQLTAYGEGDNTYPCIIALCDDGTVWLRPTANNPGDKWELIQSIPQEEHSETVEQVKFATVTWAHMPSTFTTGNNY